MQERRYQEEHVVTEQEVLDQLVNVYDSELDDEVVETDESSHSQSYQYLYVYAV